MGQSRSGICPLCGPIPAGLLWEDDRLRVIRVDGTPYPGYVRVIWRRHVAEMTDLAAADRDHLMHRVWEIEALQRRLLQPDKINLASLGNQVPHLHWHLIPRWRGDPCFPDAIWAAPDGDPGQQAATWARQQARLAGQAERLYEAIAATLSTGAA